MSARGSLMGRPSVSWLGVGARGSLSVAGLRGVADGGEPAARAPAGAIQRAERLVELVVGGAAAGVGRVHLGDRGAALQVLDAQLAERDPGEQRGAAHVRADGIL